MEYDLIWGQEKIPGEVWAQTRGMNRSEIVGGGGREKNIPGNLESGLRGPKGIKGVHTVFVFLIFIFIYF